MRHFVLAIALAAAALGAGCSATQSVTQSQFIERGDVMDVSRRIVEAYAASWNANDMSRFGALYAGDARHVTQSGDFLRGRGAIVTAHRNSRPAEPTRIRMVTQLEGARAVTNDTIIAVMRREFVNDPSAPNGIQATRITLTLVRRDGEWLIAQAQASAPD